ncbi:MAG TPA: NAD(P)-dependent oxidoreductase [Pirellulaceae bacterium]|nr:NAD(P)-dependent oxidoreductase [Pirellulaceae bacterium]
MPRVGIIGLGLVGSALAERFLAAGHEVCGYDLSPARCELLARLGGIAAADGAEVARQCECLVLSLPTSQIASQVLVEICSELPGKLVIDTTTGEPEAMARLGAWLAERGVTYLDATIAGSSAQVRRGEVVVMLGGTEAAASLASDLIATFARQCFHLGPVGSGARMKLVVNLVLGLNRAVLAEGLSFAKASGVDPAKALEVLAAGPAFSRVMETKGRKMLVGDFEPEARLTQHHKDVKLILEAAQKSGAKLPLTQLHELLLSALVAAGCGELDNSVIVRAFLPQGLTPGQGAA